MPGEKGGEAMSIQGKNITINGLDLNVVVEGEGEPVLLLHGFPG